MTKSNIEKKKFSLIWGSGFIEEEVQIVSRYHVPTIQLLKFTEGEAKGSQEIRFCHYSHEGRFQRSPLILDLKDITKLSKALEKTPKLKKILKQLVKIKN
tara:strand:+ start:214 stop:513 length:300 start_codon:yes stop_codon:yes gene_type:complete